MKRIAMQVLLSLSMSCGGAALAADTWCSGKVDYWYIDNTGLVKIFWGGNAGGYTPICNVNSTYNTITPVTCLTWTAQVKSHLTKTGSVLWIGWSDAAACGKATTPNVIGVVLTNP